MNKCPRGMLTDDAGTTPRSHGSLANWSRRDYPPGPLLKGWERCRHNTFAASVTGGAIKPARRNMRKSDERSRFRRNPEHRRSTILCASYCEFWRSLGT